MSNETVVRVTADASGYTSGIDKARRSAEQFIASQDAAAARTKAAQDAISEAVANGSQASTRQINAFITALAKQAEVAGKSGAEIRAMQAAQLGVSGAAQGYIEKIASATSHTEGLNFATAGARRELLVLAHEASQGNWTRFGGSLMVLGERVDAMSLIFSSAGAAVAGAALIVGAFGLAAIKGAMQSEALNHSLQMTGGFAGIAEGQFNALSKTLADAEHTGIGKARDVLQSLVSTGQFTGDALVQVGSAAISMAKLSDASAEDVAKDFAKMADGVIKWVDEHNKQYHFLSAAQYDHIRLLEEEGQKQQAMAETGKLIDAAMQSQVTNLGFAQRAWRSIGEAASQAWDKMLGLGRTDTPEDKIARLQEKIDYQNKHAGGMTGMSPQALKAFNANASVEMNGLVLAKKQQDLAAQAKADKDGHEQSLIDAGNYIRKLREQTASNSDKRLKEIKDYNKQAEILQLDGATRERDIAAINEKYKDKAPKKPKAVIDDAATKFLQNLRDQDAATQAALASNDKLTGAEKQQAEFLQKIADFKSKTILTAEQKSLLANQDTIKAQLQQNVADEQKLQLKQDLQKMDERALQIQQQIQLYQTNQNAGYKNQLDAFGQGRDAQTQVAAIQSITKEYEKLNFALEKQTPKDAIGSQQYLKAKDDIKAGLDQSLKSYSDYYAALKAKQADWKNGASTAFADYLEQSRNVSAQTQTLFTNSFKNMEDAIVSFAQTGKLNFSSFANSLIADLIRIQVRAAESNLLTMAGQAIMGYYAQSQGYGSTSTMDGAQQVGGSGGFQQTGSLQAHAAGGYIAGAGSGTSDSIHAMLSNGEFVMNAASTSKYRALLEHLNSNGGAANVPHFAAGGMVGGGAASSLPQPLVGNSSGGVQVNVYVQQDGSSKVDAPAGFEKFGKELGDFVDARINKSNMKSARQGGQLWNAQNGMA